MIPSWLGAIIVVGAIILFFLPEISKLLSKIKKGYERDKKESEWVYLRPGVNINIERVKK